MIKWEQGQELLGEYLIEKEIGQSGGMGRVWLVKSSSTGRRFAVKQTKLKDDKSRKAFLTELQTWIDLPEHPNIVPCRFFRTVGDEIVIFADYIEGGSLADWIAKGKLTRLEQILDVAIQISWGLHAIHERGLVHQDVKPGNVLMTAACVPMVADFGLARARQQAQNDRVHNNRNPNVEDGLLVSYAGKTKAYASPEQMAGDRLSCKTDIWSWGVCVLDMFVGEPSCLCMGGYSAEAVLNQFMEGGGKEAGHPKMNEELAQILRLCFMLNPDKRPSAIDIINKLELILPDTQRKAEIVNILLSNNQAVCEGEQFVNCGGDVVRWLEMAYRSAHKNPSSAIQRYKETCSGGTQAKSVRQFAALEEAIEVLNDSKVHSASDIQCHQALIQRQKANILFSLNDISAADSIINDSIHKMTQLLARENTVYIAGILAGLHIDKGGYARAAGKPAEAISSYERTLKIINEMHYSSSAPFIEVIRAQAWGDIGTALQSMARNGEAIQAEDKCISICKSIDSAYIYANRIKQIMALAYLNKGLSYCNTGKCEASILSLNSAETLLLSLQEDAEWQEAKPHLAHCYMNYGITMVKMKRHQESVEYYDKCINIYRNIVGTNNRHPLLHMLAIAINNKAFVNGICERFTEAHQGFDEAISILRNIFETYGRGEMRLLLAQALSYKARLCNTQGDTTTAQSINKEVMNIYCILIKEDKRDDLWGDYLVVVLSAYYMFRFNGQWTPAMTDTIRDAFQTLQRVVIKTNRQDLANQLEIALEMYGDLLK